MKNSITTIIIDLIIISCVSLMLAACTGAAEKKPDTGTAGQDSMASEKEIASDAVPEEQTEETVPEETVPTTQDYRALVTETLYAMDHVNVRSSPDTSGNAVGMLEPDEEVLLIKNVTPEWSEILYSDVPAYVASRYLTHSSSHSVPTRWRLSHR